MKHDKNKILLKLESNACFLFLFNLSFLPHSNKCTLFFELLCVTLQLNFNRNNLVI